MSQQQSILELLTPEEVLKFKRKVKKPFTGMRKLFFPDHGKIYSLTYKYFEVMNASPVVAKIHAFNSQAEVIGRPGGREVSGDLFKWSQATNLDEEEILRKYMFSRQNTTDQDDAVLAAYNDVLRTSLGIEVGIEMYAMHALATGKWITEKKIGNQMVKAEIDYKVPVEHQDTLNPADNWENKDHSILSDLRDWAKIGKWKYAITDEETVRCMQNNVEIQKTLAQLGFFSVDGSFDLPSLNDINERIMKKYGWPIIATYQEPEEPAQIYNNDGELEEVKLFPEGYFVGMKTMALGKTVWAKTAEEIHDEAEGKVKTKKSDHIYSHVEHSKNPVKTWTESNAIAAIAFEGSRRVLQAKVR